MYAFATFILQVLEVLARAIKQEKERHTYWEGISKTTSICM
jgi:hypothetical protein